MGSANNPEFKGWFNENVFILEREKGKVEFINVRNFSKDTLEYNSDELTFIGSNNQIDKLLFRKNDDKNTTTHVVKDKNGNSLKEFSIEGNNTPYFDEINNGYLIIENIENGSDQPKECEDTSCRKNIFHYLNLGNLTLKSLLETDYAQVFGRGCYPTYIVPDIDMVYINPQCLILNEGYTNSEGYIELKLR